MTFLRLVLAIGWITLALLGANEPSVFEAGNLDNPTPYGLTPAEKKIHENARRIDRLQKQLFSLQQRLNALDEKVDGLKSVVEGIDERINQLRRGERGGENMQAELMALRADLNASIAAQKENNAQIKKVLREMSGLIDKIASSYVTHAELKSELDKIYALLKKRRSSKSGAELFKEGYAAFKKGQYDRAKELFLSSIDKHYRPAASSFYVGESCYYQKDYSCAVKYYKKSASLYQNASYMPTLLLHTAISLDRLGDKEEAKKFYSSVVKLYPKSKAATIAKKNLKKLQ